MAQAADGIPSLFADPISTLAARRMQCGKRDCRTRPKVPYQVPGLFLYYSPTILPAAIRRPELVRVFLRRRETMKSLMKLIAVSAALLLCGRVALADSYSDT